MDGYTAGSVSEGELALCRATLYGALSLGFCLPTPETVERLGSVAGTAALADAAELLDGDLVGPIWDLKDKVENLEYLVGDYRRFFGHTVRGPVPPYETEYGVDGLFLQPQEMSDIGGFMSAFGLVVNPAGHERVDHISCECEFLYFLCQKEAYALEQSDEAMLVETRRAERLFLKDHLGRFGPTFGRRTAREDPDGFYGALGELCAVFIEGECRRADIPVGSEDLQLRSALPDNVPMACGAEEDGTNLIEIEDMDGFQTP